MLRIYLDQAKWVALSRYRVGHRLGAKYRDAYDMSTEAVTRNQASFVLSCAHYFETQRRRDARSRRQLGETMAHLSRFHAIAPVTAVVPAEIRQYLTGVPMTRDVNLFGVGFNHAFSSNVDLGRVDPRVLDSAPISLHAQIVDNYSRDVELHLLAAPESKNDSSRTMLEVAARIKVSSQRFVDSQNTISEHIDTYRMRGRLADVAAATEVADFIDPLIAECTHAGIDIDEVLGTDNTIRDLLHNLPSRWVTSELRRVRLQNPQQQWKANDLNDILSLSIAVPYCDIVVTERQWARHLNQSGLARRYGTTVLHDLTKLTEAIVTASAA